MEEVREAARKGVVVVEEGVGVEDGDRVEISI
jgi:hypothetical protein